MKLEEKKLNPDSFLSKRIDNIETRLLKFINDKGKFRLISFKLKEDNMIEFEKLCLKVYNKIKPPLELRDINYIPTAVLDAAVAIEKLIPKEGGSEIEFYSAFVKWARRFLLEENPKNTVINADLVQGVMKIKEEREKNGETLRLKDCQHLLKEHWDHLSQIISSNKKGITTIADALEINRESLVKFIETNYPEWLKQYQYKFSNAIKDRGPKQILEDVNNSSWKEVAPLFNVSGPGLMGFMYREYPELFEEYPNLVPKKRKEKSSTKKIQEALGEEIMNELEKIKIESNSLEIESKIKKDFIEKYLDKIQEACIAYGIEKVSNVLGIWDNNKSLRTFLKDNYKNWYNTKYPKKYIKN